MLRSNRTLIVLCTLMAALCTGCASHAAVFGNIASMLVAVGLFYGTINLTRPKK